jgi:tetratricopeptide (TPR) repeat protein
MRRPWSAGALLAALAASSCFRYDDARGPETRTDPAVALMERRTAEDPRDHLSPTTLAELRLSRADATGDVEEYRRAETAARTALARKPDHLAGKVALARALLGEGRGDEARRVVHEILDAQPRHVGALAAAFDVAFAAGDDRAAQSYADRLLAINEAPETLSRVGRLAERRGDCVGAAALYRRAAVGAENLGGMPSEIDGYRRLEAHALAAAKAGAR